MPDKYKRQPVDISIIIPSWFTNDQDGKYGKLETYWFACACLDRLIKVTPKERYELIIIDNGSDLTTGKLMKVFDFDGHSKEESRREDIFPIEDYWKKADILIRNQENLGFAPACNQGFNVARGKYILCLNNDILVWEGWDKEMTDYFEELEQTADPKPGVLMPSIVKKSYHPQFVDPKTEKMDALIALKVDKKDIRLPNMDAMEAGAEFGSMWMIKKEFMDEIRCKDGYVFDENFRIGFGEDRDLWKRVRLMGKETYRNFKLRVYHQGNMSMGKIPDRKTYTEQNREYLKQKWQK